MLCIIDVLFTLLHVYVTCLCLLLMRFMIRARAITPSTCGQARSGHMRCQLQLRQKRRLGLPSLLAQDNPLLASLSSHSGRRKAARPSSLAICSARCLQFSVRRANFANCFFNVFGGPFAKNSRFGARRSKRSSSLVAPVWRAKCKEFIRKMKEFRCVRCGRFGGFAETAPRVGPSMESKM